MKTENTTFNFPHHGGYRDAEREALLAALHAKLDELMATQQPFAVEFQQSTPILSREELSKITVTTGPIPAGWCAVTGGVSQAGDCYWHPALGGWYPLMPKPGQAAEYYNNTLIRKIDQPTIP